MRNLPNIFLLPAPRDVPFQYQTNFSSQIRSKADSTKIIGYETKTYFLVKVFQI